MPSPIREKLMALLALQLLGRVGATATPARDLNQRKVGPVSRRL